MPLEAKSVLDAAEKGLQAAAGHFLLKDPKCIEMKDAEGGTALHLASEHGHTSILEMLLSRRADLEAKDDYGLTALHLAAYGGHVAVVRLLARHGALLDIEENNGLTPAKLATLEGHDEVASLLEELEAAANPGEQADARAAARCPGGLIQAARDGLAGAVRHFIKRDLESMEKKARFGKTALHLAAEKGHDSIVQTLLSHDAAVDSKTTNGLTALHFAAANGHASVVEMLLRRGAAVDVKGKNGKTPADVAEESGQKQVAELLRPAADAAGGSFEGGENQHLEAPAALFEAEVKGGNGFKDCLASEGAPAPLFVGAAGQALRRVKASEAVPGGCRMTMCLTLLDRPALLVSTQEIPYEGHIVAGADECIVSFPGKYAAGWDALIREHGGNSVACVFLTTPESGLGKHAPDPDAPDKPCYCHRIYGERGHKAFGYLFQVGPPYTEERMAKARANAEAMNAVVVREDASPEERAELEAEAELRYHERGRVAAWGCFWFQEWKDKVCDAVAKGQRLVVIYFPGQTHQGHIEWEQLSDNRCNLWDGVGLGGSQKCEVAFLEKMRREEGDAWDFDAVDVADFLQQEFPAESLVDVWHEASGSWKRGYVVHFSVKDSKKLGEKVTTWTVELQGTHDRCESRHVRHTTDAIQKVFDVDDPQLLLTLQEAMPEVQFEGLEQLRLSNGDSALALKLLVRDIQTMHRLRDSVLNGNAEVSLNHHLLKIRGDYGIRIDQSNFFRQYEENLHTLSELTAHQKAKLEELDQHKDVHLSAPPGAGKTFVAIQLALDALSAKRQNKILYVAPFPALGLFFVQWLIKRHHAQVIKGGGDWTRALDDLLRRVFLLHAPYTKPISLSFEAGSLVSVEANAKHFSVALLDEAQLLFSSKQLMNFYQSLQADRKLIISDAAQAAKWHPDALFTKLVQVKLNEVIRSTKRINAGALAFQANKIDQEVPSCGGTDGPPLKTFIFQSMETRREELHEYCSNIKKALWHIIASFPCLGSLHRRVAIIVPDQDFLEEIRPYLERELPETFLKRCFRLISFEESVTYLPVHLQPSQRIPEVSGEVLVLDALDNCRGLECMIVVCVGLDQRISGTDTSSARAGIYVAITRANLMAIVVDRFLPGGWLEFLSTLQLKKDQKFEESSALLEMSPKAATEIIQNQHQASMRDKKEKEAEDLRADGQETAEGHDHPPEQQSGASGHVLRGSAPSEEPEVLATRATSVWDTDSNWKPVARSKLAFDPWEAAHGMEVGDQASRQSGIVDAPMIIVSSCINPKLNGKYALLPEKLNDHEVYQKVEDDESLRYHLFYHHNPRNGWCIALDPHSGEEVDAYLGPGAPDPCRKAFGQSWSVLKRGPMNYFTKNERMSLGRYGRIRKATEARE